MLTYLLKVNICWAMFYLLYWSLMRYETFFRINRLYLVASVLLGLLLPLWSNTIQNTDYQGVITYYLAPVIISAKQTSQSVQQWSWDYDFWWRTLYFLGIAFFTVKLLVGFSTLFSLYRNADRTYHNRILLLRTDKYHLPFSFFKMIFWSKDFEEQPQEGSAILKHELAHVRQLHSFDVLFFEVVQVFFWFSPVIYFYKKSLRAVHEYLADEAVTAHFSKKQYGVLLISQSQSGMSLTLTNSFIHSQLKQRFVMMLKPSSSPFLYFKYLFVVPILVIAACSLQDDLKVAQPLSNDFTVKYDVDTIFLFDTETKVESIKYVNTIDTVYNKPDVPTAFIGGQAALMNYLAANIKYPAAEQKAGIEGKVLLKFRIGKSGHITDLMVRKSSGNANLDEAAMQVIRDMQNGQTWSMEDGRSLNKGKYWTPATIKGQAVATEMILPIGFKTEK